MLVILPLLLGISIYRWNAKFDAALISKVNDDLTIAHQYLARFLEMTQAELVWLTQSASFQQALTASHSGDEGLASLLAQTAKTRGLDFLYIVDSDGKVIAAEYPLASDTMRSDRPIIEAAFAGQARTGIDVFDAEALAAISPDLEQRAQTEIVATLGSVADQRTEETRGLVLLSASPLKTPDGRSAALVGGILLNKNLAFVDTINDLIYHGAGLPEGSTGTVTLFLGDVRISTNVRLFKDQRAIGTRVSEEVRAAVLDQGRTWLDRAFVVNDWYVSAYEPLLNNNGERVGMLYSGFLQKPFTDAKRQTLVEIALAFLIAIAVAIPLFLKWAAGIFRPLERMAATIGRIERGDLDARTGHVDDRDEIGRVALHLDRSIGQLQERDAALRGWNDDLNRKVDERTRLNSGGSFDLSEVIARPERIDLEFIDIIKKKHESGFSVFSFESRALMTEQRSKELVLRMLDIVAFQHDHTVVDLPSADTAWKDDVIAAVNSTIVVTTNSVPALQQARSVVRRIGDVRGNPGDCTVLINKVRGSFFNPGVRAKDMVKIFGETPVVALPEEVSVMTEALNRGVLPSEVNSRSGFCKKVQALTEKVRATA